MTVPATALDVLAALKGEITGPGAEAALASYFAPGPEPGSIRRRPRPRRPVPNPNWRLNYDHT